MTIWPISTPKPTQPRTTTYRGYEIYKPGFWTQGPVMIEALNMLEGFDLQAPWATTARSICTPWSKP